MHKLRAVLLGSTLALLTACGSDSGSGRPGAADDNGWIGAWAAAPYGPYPFGPLSGIVPIPLPVPLPPIPTLFVDDHAVDQSFRMIVHPTIGGERVRVRLSNLMGDREVRFEPVRIARSLLLTGPAIVPGTDAQVLFDGEPGVTVAAGAEAISDPLDFAYAVGEDLAISFAVVGESGPITWHAVSFGPNYVSLPRVGDTTADVSGLTFTQATLGWFFVSGIDVHAPDSDGTIVAIGDSITDGAYTFVNTRWPDFFAQRLRAAGVAMGVLNQGINSNTVTREGISTDTSFQGPAAIDRFARDVLQRPAVRSVVIFEGTNDLSAGVDADTVFGGIRNMVERAHAAGLCVVVGTIMPRGNTPVFTWPAEAEAERLILNALIRAQTDVEGIADFDQVMALPLAPALPNPLYYSPDLLHPTSVGTLIMAGAVPLEALVPPPLGNCTR